MLLWQTNWRASSASVKFWKFFQVPECLFRWLSLVRLWWVGCLSVRLLWDEHESLTVGWKIYFFDKSAVGLCSNLASVQVKQSLIWIFCFISLLQSTQPVLCSRSPTFGLLSKTLAHNEQINPTIKTELLKLTRTEDTCKYLEDTWLDFLAKAAFHVVHVWDVEPNWCSLLFNLFAPEEVNW